MKIGGIDPKTLPNEEVLVLPRGDKAIIFRAQGLPDMDDFHNMVPEPKMPGRLLPTGFEPNPSDPGYQSVLAEYNKRRMSYLVVKSLEPSNIEWDTVKIDSPGTWSNWEKDLKDGGLTQVECNLVFSLAFSANQLDEAKLKKARDAFLLGPGLASAQ